MCGIAGLIFDELQPDGAAWLTDMTQTMFHRGPDSGGAVAFGLCGRPVIERRFGGVDEPVKWDYLPLQVGLGARRLAILDTSAAGHQPMSGGDGQAWIVFNGAIYNYRALRDTLKAAGISFRGMSDTEVLLAAYRHWGMACFTRLDGMWACAIFEPAAGRVVLSRDRLGIKPLYVTRLKAGFAFASEIKAILKLPGFPHETDSGLLRDFLTRGHVDHTDRTFFESIWSVPAGCSITFNLRGGQGGTTGTIESYWSLTPNTGMDGVSSADVSPLICQTLEDAVASHLVSDVPVGSCLSGGIDSSALVCMASRIASADRSAAPNWSQHTFTACLPGTTLDERPYAEAVVESCRGLVGHYVEPTGERLLADIGRLVRHQEEPFGSPSIYMQYEVMRAARESGVTVLLDGQGADELFCGYEGYVPPLLASQFRRGRIGDMQRMWREAVRAGWYRRRSLAAHTAAYMIPRRLRTGLREARNRWSCGWLARELFDVEPAEGIVEGLGLTGSVDKDNTTQGGIGGFVRDMTLADSLPSLLRFEDRNSMAFSIEARVPYLDRQLVEAAMRISADMHMRDGRLKAVLHDAVDRFVPPMVRQRRDKIGFSAPTGQWMRGPLRPWWQDILASKSFRDRGCFDVKGTHKLIGRFDAGDDAATPAIWRLAIVEQWAREFMDKSE